MAWHLDHLKKSDHIGKEEKSLSPEILRLVKEFWAQAGRNTWPAPRQCTWMKSLENVYTLIMTCGRIYRKKGFPSKIHFFPNYEFWIVAKPMLMLFFFAFTFFVHFQMWAVCPCWCISHLLQKSVMVGYLIYKCVPFFKTFQFPKLQNCQSSCNNWVCHLQKRIICPFTAA